MRRAVPRIADLTGPGAKTALISPYSARWGLSCAGRETELTWRADDDRPRDRELALDAERMRLR